MKFEKTFGQTVLNIEKGTGVAITLIRESDDFEILTIQLSPEEAIKAASIMHTKGELYDEIRRLNDLVDDLVNRNEELRMAAS